MPSAGHGFEPGEEFARRLDAEDPLRGFRERFFLPPRPDGRPAVYLCGHSLGLQPKATPALLAEELNAWANLGVEGHFKEKDPWYSYHELFGDRAARLVGALPGEVVVMNSLTVNLHLTMLTFYRPTPAGHKILTDAPVFPSDLYALQSQLRYHGFDPREGLIALSPR